MFTSPVFLLSYSLGLNELKSQQLYLRGNSRSAAMHLYRHLSSTGSVGNECLLFMIGLNESQFFAKWYNFCDREKTTSPVFEQSLGARLG